MRPVLLLAILLGACTGSRTPLPTPASPDPGEAIEAAVGAALDPSADPCKDFYAYACGGWIEATELPDDKPIITRGFSTLADQNEQTLKALLEGLAEAPPADDPVAGRLGRFYAACMDTEAIEARGAEPIAPLLREVEEITAENLLSSLGALQRVHGINPFFRSWPQADEQNPGLNILQLSQARLGLPERSYYLDGDQAPLREAYADYLHTLFALTGHTDEEAALAAQRTLDVETRLAGISWAPGQLRDSEATYNKLDRPGLKALAPAWDWDAWLQGLGKAELHQINIRTPSYFELLPEALGAFDEPTLRAALQASILRTAAPHLSSDFVEADFAFYGRTLSGQQAQRPRWKQCVSRTDTYLGDLLGQAYVEVAFPGESKTIALDMIERIERAFLASLPQLAWMDDETREKAAIKARSFRAKIGYPDQWRTYEGVEIGDGYWENLTAASAHYHAELLDRLEQPVDRELWFMTPPTVNAYYHPVLNEIAFPAGILQPPMYGVNQPMAMNFGAIGMIVGHEITHGFDDQGRKYDSTGRLEPWWAPEVSEAFEANAQCVEELYSGFEALPGQYVDGQLTLGENIADLGGLKQAWAAWRDWADAQPEPLEPVAGLNGDQLFFVSYAQAWCTVARPQVQEVRLRTDPHAPPRFRVNGAVMNLPAFGETFSCEPGAPMRPAEICEVW